MKKRQNHTGPMEKFNKEINFLINNFPSNSYTISKDKYSYKLIVNIDEELLSNVYPIEIEHKYNESPSCRILKEILDEIKPPKLHLHPTPLSKNIVKIKGIHNSVKLLKSLEKSSKYYYPCVYVNKKDENEWRREYTIDEYILWIKQWLNSYEFWVLNDKWLGEEYAH